MSLESFADDERSIPGSLNIPFLRQTKTEKITAEHRKLSIFLNEAILKAT